MAPVRLGSCEHRCLTEKQKIVFNDLFYNYNIIYERIEAGSFGLDRNVVWYGNALLTGTVFFYYYYFFFFWG